MPENTQIVLVERPAEKLEPRHFEQRTAPMPEPGDGEVLIETLLLSQDAANRAWLQGATYKSAVEPGDVMHCYGLGRVTHSRSPSYSAGDLVLGEVGWQRYVALPAEKLEQVGDHRPLTHHLSVLGIAGLTAYEGLINIGEIAEGETLLVSAAAGSVGSIVGQIGKILGARVVGVAGGPDKCAWVRDELGFDACIDYKNADVGAGLREHCPKGVDVYFDNVGGPVLQQALFAMRNHGRIVCCGAVSMYDGGSVMGPMGIPGLLVIRRIRMQGFIVMDHPERLVEARDKLAGWLADGRLKVAEDVIEGLENAPAGLIGLLAGENRGKRMIRVAPLPGE